MSTSSLSATTSTTGVTQLSGLASGLDTSSIIASLMAVAQEPQQLLENQITTLQGTVSSLQSLNSQLAALATATDPLTGSVDVDAYQATSSDSSVATATADSTATVGSISFTVDQVASPQVDVTAAYSAWPESSPELTIVTGSGSTTVTAGSDSISDVAAAINGANAGVTAQVVSAGTDAGGDPLYRLQLSSTTPGAAGTFTVYDGADASGTDLMSEPGAAQISAAQDAQITLWPGTSAAQTVTSTSDLFDDLMPGVDVTVAATSSYPVTLSVGQDTATDAQNVQTLVNSVNSVLSAITQGDTTSQTTQSDGTVVTTLGPFTTDSTVRGVASDLTDALTMDVGGTSLSSIGISLNDDGSIAFDQSAFEQALAANPAQVQSLLTTVVGRVNQAATEASDPTQGSLTAEISDDNDTITQMQSKSDDMTTLLQQQQATLQQEYDYMETMISQIDSQGTYIQQMIDSMDSGSSSSSTSSS